MYKLPYYTEQDEAKVISFIKEHSFATVVGYDGEYPVASQLPLEISEADGKLSFTGHLMKKTNHHLAFEKNDQVLVIFSSPHAYINAAWYTNPAVGSTVNYIAVHVKGTIEFTDDAGTYEAVKKITDKHIGTNSPASFNNLSAEYIDTMIKAIVGFTIKITSVENVFKLSQNRNEDDQKNIIAHLEARSKPGDLYIAEEMKQRIISK